jgi:hypothetical protein
MMIVGQYLNWRYQNPLSHYRFLFWKRNRLEGYLVVEQPTSAYANSRRISIVDWEGTSKEVCSGLLDVIISDPYLEELFIWAGTLSATQRDLLAENGFKPTLEPGRMGRHRPCVLVRCVRDEDLKKEWTVAGKRSWTFRPGIFGNSTACNLRLAAKQPGE